MRKINVYDVLLSLVVVFAGVILYSHTVFAPTDKAIADELVETTTSVSNTTTETTSTAVATTTTSTTTKTTTVTTTTATEPTTTTTCTTTEEPVVTYVDEVLFNERKSYDNWLFVGDSRFVFWYNWGFYGEYIAESGQGLNMIYDNYDTITSYRDYNVVFNLGANQWWSGAEYVDLLNSFPDEFTQNNHIIVMPVNPTDGRFAWMNEKFDTYNSILRDNLRADYEYFDTATYMKNNGFSTADGLHYTTNEDRIIYNLLMNGE